MATHMVKVSYCFLISIAMLTGIDSQAFAEGTPLLTEGVRAFAGGVDCSGENSGDSSDDSAYVQLDRYSVHYGDEIIVTFRNVSDQKIWVFTSGCGLPDNGYLPIMVVEKKKDGDWDIAGLPVCIAIAAPPIVLEPGESVAVSFPVSTGLEDVAPDGWFRYEFDIRFDGDSDDMVSRIPKHLRVSQAFEIIGI